MLILDQDVIVLFMLLFICFLMQILTDVYCGWIYVTVRLKIAEMSYCNNDGTN